MRLFPALKRGRTAIVRSASALVISCALIAPAGAATFQFDFGSALGTFDAPLGGGVISAFNVTIGDTTFDTPAAGATQPVYNPILNTFSGIFDVEFTGFGSSTGAVFNSAPSGTCPVGDFCVLELFSTSAGTAAPEWAFQNITQLTNVTGGFYSIDPSPLSATVPLPAALPLLLSALAAMGLLGWRRKRTAPALSA